MPYNSIKEAKAAGFPTNAEGIPMTLAQINKLAEIYDTVKAKGGADNPMVVAWTQWKKIYKKEGKKWMKIESKDMRNNEVNFIDKQPMRDFSPFSIDSKIIDETNKFSTFNMQLTKHGVLNGGYQSEEETKALIPFANGIPIIIDHPDFSLNDYRSIIIEDRSKAIGVTSEMQEAKINNVLVVKGKANIFSQYDEVIKNIKNKKFINNSMGSYLIPIKKSGTFNGENYNHLRTVIMPFHTALLTKAIPACAPPFCGTNLDQKKYTCECLECGKIIETTEHCREIKCPDCGAEMRRIERPGPGQPKIPTKTNKKLYIPRKVFSINKITGVKMVNTHDDSTDNAQVIKQEAKPISLEDLSLDSLKANPEILKLIEKSDNSEKEIKKIKDELEKAKNENKELLPFKKEIEEKAKKELKEKKEALKKLKVIKDEKLEKMNIDEVNNILEVLESTRKPDSRMIFPPIPNSEKKEKLKKKIENPLGWNPKKNQLEELQEDD